MSNIYILKCACGVERETDIPLDKMKPKKWDDSALAPQDPARCSRCGAFEWKVGRNIAEKIAKDPSAPQEMKQTKKKKRWEDEGETENG